MTELHKNHRARLRAHYEKDGLDGFADHMLFELILFQSIPRADTNPIGHRLLEKFGTPEGVFAASEEELCSVSGVGPKTARMLKDAREHMLFRILESRMVAEDDFRLAVAAEYHMRDLPEGAVSLINREFVFDYTTDGGEDGLCDAIRCDIEEYGITEYDVIVKAEENAVSDELKNELRRGEFDSVYVLDGERLTKLFQ